MKSKTKVRLAAGAMVLSLSGPAFAQPTQINTGNLVSALNNVNVEIDHLNVLNDLTITDVQVGNVEDSVNNRVLNNVLNNNQTDIAVLQDFLNNSVNNNIEIIKNVLNNDVDIDDVVAIDVLRNGDVVLFVDRL